MKEKGKGDIEKKPLPVPLPELEAVVGRKRGEKRLFLITATIGGAAVRAVTERASSTCSRTRCASTAIAAFSGEAWLEVRSYRLGANGFLEIEHFTPEL